VKILFDIPGGGQRKTGQYAAGEIIELFGYRNKL
jgi:hypothetical protein